ncbi:carboxymuconolactone decarboxylase family protein [Paraburkholderia susongensis]|nr:carboxymuconolactone decarboxylase family protein [Paraburkholderia susongensis]
MGAIGQLGTAAQATLAGFHALDSAAAKGGKLDAKTRELISLAVAVTTRCDGCIAVHSAAAAKAGASREEVAEALSVAIALNAGAALVYSARALDAFGQQSG